MNISKKNAIKILLNVLDILFLIEDKYKIFHKIFTSFIELINICDVYSIFEINVISNTCVNEKKINFVDKISNIFFSIYTNIGEDAYYECIQKIYNHKLIFHIEREFYKNEILFNNKIYHHMRQLLISFNNDIFSDKSFVIES